MHAFKLLDTALAANFLVQDTVVEMSLQEAAQIFARANEEEETEAMAENDCDYPSVTDPIRTANDQGLFFLKMVANDRVCAVCAYTFYQHFLDPLPASIWRLASMQTLKVLGHSWPA